MVAASSFVIAFATGNTYGIALAFVVTAVLAAIGLPLLILAFLITELLRSRLNNRETSDSKSTATGKRL